MNGLIRFVSISIALWGALTLADLKYRTSGIVLWPLKIVATALAPVIALAGALLASLGLKRRDALAAGMALLGAAAAARYTVQVIAPHDGFAQAFGPNWQERIAPAQRTRFLHRRWTPLMPAPPRGVCQRDLTYGLNPTTGQPLLADLWQPAAGVSRSGLGVIYVHGGAWRLGAKDMGTRTFFRRLASQGHVVMDIAYTLAPETDVSGMVGDVKRALIWLKQNAAAYRVDPQRIVLIGGSAGGHLALLAAFTPNDPTWQPDASLQPGSVASPVDTSVRAVVSFYGPVDFRDVYADVDALQQRLMRRKRIRPYGYLIETLLQMAGLVPTRTPIESSGNYIAHLLGAEPGEQPDLYQQLSPAGRVGAHCPPTLLLQGAADIFGMSRSVRQLHQTLAAAGVPAVLVEFPNTDHAFDLVLPRISPSAQAALYDVERFLALMV
jgi:acetyl esterase/lipase